VNSSWSRRVFAIARNSPALIILEPTAGEAQQAQLVAAPRGEELADHLGGCAVDHTAPIRPGQRAIHASLVGWAVKVLVR
jgi:hypothetical protein